MATSTLHQTVQSIEVDDSAVTMPPLTNTEEPSGEDGLYNDDAQTVMQPALSATATRLTLPKTPFAEKAAAMDSLPQGPFLSPVTVSPGQAKQEEEEEEEEEDVSSGLTSVSSPKEIPKRSDRDNAAEPRPSTTRSPKRSTPQVYSDQRSNPPRRQDSLPTPWRSTPDDPFFTKDVLPRRALESFSLGQTRLSRSGSTGADTFKRLSKALPSLPNPSSLFSSVSNSLFPSSPSRSPNSSLPALARSSTHQADGRGVTSPPARAHSMTISHPAPPSRPLPVHRPSLADGPGPRAIPRTSAVSNVSRPQSLRRTNSDDSLLYHSLSRVSSLGDDNRFENVREMTNVRMKAIRDSLPERPTFKMPSMPSMPKFNSHLKMFQAFEEPSIPPIPEAPATSSDTDASAALDRVLDTLTGDLVILGGYRGSVLRSAESPHQQLWAPVKIGFNLRQADLEVGLDPESEATMEERIVPSGMLQNIGPIDISRKLFKKVRSCENARNGKLRVWDYGYDWRLSPHLLSHKMTKFLEGLPSNQPNARGPKGALVIAHSLGGVITRHVVNQRPDLYSGVVYAGVPQRCINVLGPLRNGDAVLLNEKILTAQVNFSMRTTFAFLPEDGFCFIDKETDEEYPIDFFDANEWAKHRLSPCVGTALPALTPRPPSGFGSILRNRSNSEKQQSQQGQMFPSPSLGDTSRQAETARERLPNPQLDSNRSSSSPSGAAGPSPFAVRQPSPPPPANRARSMAYLERILGEIKRFRAELAHRPSHSAANAYPPTGLIYGKNTPTVYAAKVAGREGIGCADAYDDLVFRSGDGVVLAREAQLPAGYELVKGGRVCSERGHLTMMGDLPAIGKALDVVIRGRRKGIGLGKPRDKAGVSEGSSNGG